MFHKLFQQKLQSHKETSLKSEEEHKKDSGPSQSVDIPARQFLHQEFNFAF